MLKNYLKLADRNIDEFEEIYQKVIEYFNEILSLEKIFPANKKIKNIQQNNLI